jgi:hypothetical protein
MGSKDEMKTFYCFDRSDEDATRQTYNNDPRALDLDRRALTARRRNGKWEIIRWSFRPYPQHIEIIGSFDSFDEAYRFGIKFPILNKDE